MEEGVYSAFRAMYMPLMEIKKLVNISQHTDAEFSSSSG
jgi:hypothetical protein